MFFLLALAVQAKPPLRDNIQVAVIMLYQGDSRLLKSPLPGDIGWVPKAKMPYSADLYLRSSGKINARHPVVLEAVRQIRKQATGHTGVSPFFDNPHNTMKAVSAWIDNNIQRLVDTPAMVREASLWTDLWPSASQILRQKNGDDFSRVRVATAIMRAFKIPARPCWFRGKPAVQYWVQPVTQGKKKSKKKKPWGYWVLDQPRYAGEAVDSYALKVGDFDWVQWEPAQEMSVKALPFQQAYYPLSLSLTAQKDFEYARRTGRLPSNKQASAVPPRPPQTGEGSTPYLRLVRVAYQFSTEGALQAMLPVRLLVPYLDHQDFNLEASPFSPKTLKIKAKAIWTNRPGRLISQKGRDYYDQYLPAMGYYHRVGVRLRKAKTLLNAHIEKGVLKGLTLRAGNLAPNPDSEVDIQFGDSVEPVLKLVPDEKGYFEYTLSEKNLENTWIKVSASRTSRPKTTREELILPIPQDFFEAD